MTVEGIQIRSKGMRPYPIPDVNSSIVVIASAMSRNSVPISRLSPIDDEVQSWNSDEYEAGYQARQEGATGLIYSNPELARRLGRCRHGPALC
jgi:hypothetical protein